MTCVQILARALRNVVISPSPSLGPSRILRTEEEADTTKPETARPCVRAGCFLVSPERARGSRTGRSGVLRNGD